MRSGIRFCSISLQFSHSVRLDVSAHFSALGGEEFFVVEGSGDAGSQTPRRSATPIKCIRIGVSWANTIVILPRPHHNHHNHHHLRSNFGSRLEQVVLPFFFWCNRVVELEAGDLPGGWWRGDVRCKAEERAALAVVVATRV